VDAPNSPQQVRCHAALPYALSTEENKGRLESGPLQTQERTLWRRLDLFPLVRLNGCSHAHTLFTRPLPPLLQKLLNEFSLAYMVADFFFYLLPCTPDGEQPGRSCLAAMRQLRGSTAAAQQQGGLRQAGGVRGWRPVLAVGFACINPSPAWLCALAFLFCSPSFHFLLFFFFFSLSSHPSFLTADYVFMVHHSISAVYLVGCLLTRHGAIGCILMFFLGEVTSPVFNVFNISKELRHQSKAAYQVFRLTSPLFTVAFVGVRSVVAPPVVGWFVYSVWFRWAHHQGVPSRGIKHRYTE
jgi:hypothetical protein